MCTKIPDFPLSAIPGEVAANNPSGAQGNNGFGACQISADYAAYEPHSEGIAEQPGWLELQFDNGECILRSQAAPLQGSSGDEQK